VKRTRDAAAAIYLGIDFGTTSTKSTLIDAETRADREGGA
jgi:sugar (pentulose or hexulose) kinase